MQSWLAKGSSGARVIFLPGTAFVHLNTLLEEAIIQRIPLNNNIPQPPHGF